MDKTPTSDSDKEPSRAPSEAHLVVGIGASAGGLQAVREMLSRVEADAGIAYVLIMHLDPTHESALPEILAKGCAVPVVQISNGMPLQPDRVHVIAPDREVSIDGPVFSSLPAQNPRGLRVPVDSLLRSVAFEFAERSAAVILSGSGSDGSWGIQEIKGEGGLVIVQDPGEAGFDGMPRSAITTGCVDHVLSAVDIVPQLHSYRDHLVALRAHRSPDEEDFDCLEKILALILVRTARDFRPYKRDTLRRRVLRRMGVGQTASMADYHELLQRSGDELGALVDDLYIGVTSFFRDPHAWDTLESEALQRLVSDHDAGQPFRVWVPGCSTGEEAFSLAMLLHDIARAQNRDISFSIFATDNNPKALAIARSATYPAASAVAQLSSERIKRYMERKGETYTVLRTLRERVTFAQQDVLGDPPFSNLALISCRNLLIYINPTHQRKLLKLFHFALQPGGILFLGTSESNAGQPQLFRAVSRKARVYRRSNAQRAFPPNLAGGVAQRSKAIASRERPASASAIGTIAQRGLLEVFAPAAVLSDRDGHILYFHGPIGDFLRVPSGEPTTDLFSMAPDIMRSRLRSALLEASSSRKRVDIDGLRVKQGDAWQVIDVSIVPRLASGFDAPLFLIAFREAVAGAVNLPVSPDQIPSDLLREQLEEDLLQTREELRITTEQMEASNEEMKAANEEVMSMNEELQSTNEELETSKEELQSLNEELTTLNAQLEEKVLELERAHADLSNFLLSTRTAALFLDRDLHIHRFTPEMGRLIRVLQSDIGRPLGELRWLFDDAGLLADAERTLSGADVPVTDVQAHDGRWYQRRILPYVTEDNRIDGVVLAFNDITELKRMDLALRKNEGHLRRVTDSMPALIAYLDTELCYRFTNAAYRDWFGFDPDTLQGLRVRDVIGEAAFVAVEPYLRMALDGTEARFEGWIDFAHGPRRYISTRYMPDVRDGDGTDGIFALVLDLTKRKQTEERLIELSRETRERAEELEALFEATPVGIYIGRDPACEDMTMNEAGARLLRIDRDMNPSKTGPDADILPFRVSHRGTEMSGADLPLQQAARLGTPVHGFELSLEFTDGETSELLAYATPVFDEAGEVRGCVGSLVDVTNLRDLESSSSHNARLLDDLSSRLPIACVEFDPAGRVTSWSPGATALLGWQGEDVVGEPAARFIPIDITDRAQARDTLTVDDLEISRADGSVIRCALLDLPGVDARGGVTNHTVVFVRHDGLEPSHGA